jgi:branched-chain amino acid transport system substrate-binding protein
LAILSFACTRNEKSEINVGVILPLTGPGAPYGQAEREGMELAVNEINNGEKIDRKIHLVIEDSKTEPSFGVSAINKLIYTDKTNIVLGDIASSVTLAIAPIAEKNKVLLITPGASNPKITEAGDYIFRFYPSDDYQGKILAEWAINNDIKKVGILYINNDFGVGLKDKFKKEIESKGGKVVTEENYDQGEKDFRTHLSKIKGTKIDGLFIIAAGEENANILIQAKEMRVRYRFFAPDAFKDENIIKIAGSTAEGVVCSAPRFNLNEKRKKVEDFILHYREKYKRDPNVFAAYGYDALILVANATAKYGYDSTKIKDALYITKEDGVTGEISFDKNGDLMPKMDFFIVKNGKFQNLRGE